MFKRQMARGFFMVEGEKENKFLPVIIKGTGLSVILTLIFVLVFAFIIQAFSLTQTTVKIVNQFIKVLAIFLSSFICIRGNLGLIKGAIVGLNSIIITTLIFSLIGSNISFTLSFIIDIVFGLIIGSLSGIITVNIKKE